jgi:2-amino-4-hydroxy-6-hydroxymethyldihydropteridine diphosphokinase
MYTSGFKVCLVANESKFKLRLVFLSLGSNTGDRESNLNNAIKRIAVLGIDIKISPTVESDAWGYDDQNKYLNLICSIYTIYTPTELLRELQSIEHDLGRVRTKPIFEARTIDIDILLYDDEVIDSDAITIPHPRLALRKFVLLPFAWLSPNTFHPVLKKSIAELLKESTDETQTLPYNGIEL